MVAARFFIRILFKVEKAVSVAEKYADKATSIISVIIKDISDPLCFFHVILRVRRVLS